MKSRLWLQLFLLVLLYVLCAFVWRAEQTLGLGREFIYSIF